MPDEAAQSRTLTIDVTQTHIDNGLEHSTHYCPIALALRDHLTNPIYVNVDERDLSFREAGENIIWSADPPQQARDFIDDFDMNMPVRPFTFEAVFR
jgi:hypothetical protein